jgi:class 3 adenylate cyclase/tetratricopeptide (TPR) repeat protein
VSGTPGESAAGPSPVDRSRWRRAQSLFAAAVDLPAAERAALLARECADDHALRDEVSALLESHDRPGVLDRLADAVVAPTMSVVRAGPSSAEGRVISHYLIGERLGSGGMGLVHRARDERLGRTIALKFLPPHLGGSEDAKRRFMLEARAAAALEHPNVCTIYEIGETPEGDLFIAMPFYEGETLESRLTRGPLPVDDAVGIARAVALGLGAAHQRAIVHRDIKPSNVMLVADGRLKILDFGVAKVADSTITGSGARLGTAAYMSPEQACGNPVDARTDMWSLGVMLYEMLAGRRPFEGPTSSALLFAILTGEPAPLRDLRPEVPPALSDAVARALAKTPGRRFMSMADFVAALDAIDDRAATRTDLDASPAAAERRHLAVLVATVSDYASLVEQLEPRALDDLLARLRAEAVDVVRRHGGLVNYAIGDEIVALFGLPAGHEDDELRAVRAALELRTRAEALGTDAGRRAGLPIAVQAGIGSGSVVVQRLREGPRRYYVSGDAAIAAARLAAAAGPSGVAVGPECHRAVGPFVLSGAGPAVDVRAGQPPVAAFRVLAERPADARLDTLEQTDLTPYTGRASELSRLDRIVDRACSGEGRMVTVVGDAGIGKSRLLYELRRRVGSRGVRILLGRCQSYGGLSPYLPFVRILTEALGVSGNRPPGDEVAARITALDPSLEPFVPLYLHLLSVESAGKALPRHLHGEHLHTALLDALTAIVTVLARLSPVLLLLEDWHWADEGSRDVVDRLADIVDSCAVVLVLTSRPEGSGLAELSGRSEVLRLEPLDSEGAVAILRAVFQARDVNSALVTHIHERTGGNPFFIEQVAHTLVEEGAIAIDEGLAVAPRQLDALRLPETVQAVIRARLDRLGPDALEVLRVASVIGREFTRRLLASALEPTLDLDRALDRLRASGLVQLTHVVPEPGYRFKHVLTQEVAYGSLLEHQRRTLHATIGRALERDGGRGRDDLAETLAHHFSRAEEWTDAIRYGRQAVGRLGALSQYGDALTALERVQEWVPRLPDDEARRELRADLLLDQERLCETLGQRGRQQQIIGELISLLAPFGASARLAEAYLRQGDLLTLLKQFDAADRALGTVLRISRERSDEALERNVFRSMGLLRWHEGRHQEALDFAGRALAIDRRRGDEVAVTGDLSNIGAILISLGEYDRSRAVLEEALAMPVLQTEPARVQYVLHNLANVERATGNIDRAIEYLERAGQVSMGLLPIQQSFNLLSLANLRLQQGRLDDALATFGEAVDLSRRARHADGLAQGLRALGEVEAGLGRDGDATAHLIEAATLFAQLEDHEAEVQVSSVVAVLLERQQNWPDADRTWRAVRTQAQGLGDRRVELDAVEGIARVARRSGGPLATVAAGFEEALALAVNLGDTPRQAALHNTLGILGWEGGRYPDALAHYEAALRLCRVLHKAADEGLILNSIGIVLVRLQRFEEARTVLEEAAALNEATGERQLEADTLVALGDLSLRFGRARDALTYFERAAAIGERTTDERMARRLADARAALTEPKGR